MMSKRFWIWLCILLLVGVAVVFTVPMTRLMVLGLLQGERFHNYRPLSYWVWAIGNGDQNTRRQAAQALASIGPDARPVVPQLVEQALLEDNPAIAQALLRIDPDAAVTAFAKALTESDPRVRERAATALFQLGPQAKAALPALAAAAKDANPGVLEKVFKALERIGPEAAPALGAALAIEDTESRLGALHALQELGPGAKAAVPAIQAVLKDKDERVRHEAADALGRIGPAATAATPALLEAVADKNLNVVRQALMALEKVGLAPDQFATELQAAVPAFVAAFENNELESNARVLAVRLLGQMGPAAAAAVPALQQAAKGGALASAAQDALRKIGP
jgi:HEAT repeat protein